MARERGMGRSAMGKGGEGRERGTSGGLVWERRRGSGYQVRAGDQGKGCKVGDDGCVVYVFGRRRWARG